MGNVRYPAPVQLEGEDLPWVEHAEHLSHTLHQTGNMNKDCNRARASFIDRSVDVRQQFSFAAPDLTLQMIQVLCCDGYGSMLWKLQSDSAESYFKSWNTCVKLVHGVPRSTFTYLVKGYLGRYPGVFRKLQSSPSKEVRMLVNMIADDPRSTTCQNLRYLRRMTNLDNPEQFGSWRVRKELPQKFVPESGRCRLGLLAKLMTMKQNKYMYMEVQDSKRITAMLDSLCST